MFKSEENGRTLSFVLFVFDKSLVKTNERTRVSNVEGSLTQIFVGDAGQRRGRLQKDLYL